MKAHSSAWVDPGVQVFGRDDLLTVGEGSRIDCQTILSVGPAGMEIGRYCHVAAGCYLFGGSGRIKLGDYCFLGARSTVYTATDDLAGDCLTGPQLQSWQRNVRTGDVTFEDFAGTGTGVLILPGATLYEGSILGALSMLTKDIPAWSVVVGTGRGQRVIRVRDAAKVRALAGRADG